jgi:hypothetical protein
MYLISQDERIYNVSEGEYAILRENVPYVKTQKFTLKHLYPNLKGYRNTDIRKLRSSCDSVHCTRLA